MHRYQVKPGENVKIKDLDPDDYGDWEGKKDEGKKQLVVLRQKLDDLQNVLYAEHLHKVLVIIQAMDTGGKDGTIRDVFQGVNPQGVRVANFKVPTQEEQDHDFLWRVHKQVPGKGELAIFNRSHYEDVLVVRVHQLVPEDVWKQRYDQINQFEEMLADTGTTILKFYLNISLDEQKKRLEERMDNPAKNWKINPGDLDERKLWPDYMKAYEEVLNRTSTESAPWYVVPGNHNWYRSLVVASVLVETLVSLKMDYPPFKGDLAALRQKLSEE